MILNTSTTDLDKGVVQQLGNPTVSSIIGNKYIIIPYSNDSGQNITSYSGFTYKDLGSKSISGGGHNIYVHFYVVTATETTMKWACTDNRCLFISFD